jgi:hypothetical protein
LRIILCDRCGAKITKEEPIGHITVYGEANGYAQGNNDFAGWDFCPKCMEEISQYIKIPLKFVVPEEGGEIADELEEELDAESVIESEDEPINEPISEPIAEPVDEPKELKPREKTRAKLTAMYEAREKESEALGPGGLIGKRRCKPDWPKFKACVDAGKDNDWLAVEFGVGKKTISNWKWKLKEKVAKGQIK